MAGRCFQIKPFKMRQQQKQVSERAWQALQVEAESVKGQRGWCVCVGGGAQQCTHEGLLLMHPQPSWFPPVSPGGRKLCPCVRTHTHRHKDIPSVAMFAHAQPPPLEGTSVFLRSSPQPPPCMAPGLSPSPTAAAREEAVLAIMCRDGEGNRSQKKSHSTWINLSARAALSYPARGFPATGGGAEQKVRGQERGRDRQEPLVTNAVNYV